MKNEYPITQPFAANYTSANVNAGLRGHTGVDEVGGYGAPYHCKHEQEYVYKVLDKENPSYDGSGFTGVFTIVDNGIEVFEFLYGHGDPCVKVGDTIHKGDVVMTEANHGEVYSGNTRITLAMQQAGDKRGSHAHNQKRILYKTKEFMEGNTRIYITDNKGFYKDKEGYYYYIPFYKNGYSGCVDFMAPLFQRNLMLGMSGYDVKCLQNFLKTRGFLVIDETTQYFGTMTRKALSDFQKANNIFPTFGFFGEKTRTLINNILQ